MKNKIWVLGIAVLALAGCKKDDVGIDCTGLNPSFAADIKPMIDATCAHPGCHAAGSSNGDYTTYTGIQKDAKNGRMTNNVVVKKEMPRANSFGPSSLRQGQIDTLYCWIEAGALNN